MSIPLVFDDLLVLNSAGGGDKSQPRVTGKRTDLTAGHHKSRMDQTIKDFLARPSTPSHGPGSRGNMTQTAFAKNVGVPASAFRDRLKSNNPMVSPPVGRPALLSVTDRRAVADSVCTER